MDTIIRRLRRLHENTEASPDDQYHEYLDQHRKGVIDCYENIIAPILEHDEVDEDTLNMIEGLLMSHDSSKDYPVEFNAYRDHFYDPEHNPKSGNADYDYAWNHHQKSNPHHWQYWCLINDVDNPQVQPLDIPFKYIIEMLCDWQSAGSHYGNSAFSWYQKQKDRMILSENTRNIIEKYIIYLK